MAAVVAAGNPHTANAAAEILRAGGNAVDAVVAAGLAAFVAEPLLASAGGSGMLTIATAQGEDAVVDFFSAVPGLGGAPVDRDFIAVDINFGAAMQRFHVGRGSVAPPVAFPGLAEASRRFGRLPLSEVIGPAVELARHGAPVSPESAEVFRLLWPINELSPDTMAAYSLNDAPPMAGSRHPMPMMIDVLESFAKHGDTPPHIRDAILEAFGLQAGGCLTPEDIEAARPQVVEPRRFRIGDWEVLASPRVGGKLIGVITGELSGDPARNAPSEALRVARACRVGNAAKDSELGSTTHISILDAEGGAASMTLTNGEGCGYVIPGTPIQLNNFMGEADLNPEGFFKSPPGTPLPSMIAPSIARSSDGVLALGSGGANRIRSVVSQVLYRVTQIGESLEKAILAPRVHAENESVWLEMAERPQMPETLHALHSDFAHVYEFPTRAFFFGGVHAVMRKGNDIQGMGDPRRGGAVVRIE